MAHLSLKVDKTKEKKLTDALAVLEAHVLPLRVTFLKLMPDTRKKVLDASPIMRRIAALAEGLI